jgi:UDP-N-acetylmuramoyl-tripeptide--D-alanyl-D-alanine ligase
MEMAIDPTTVTINSADVKPGSTFFAIIGEVHDGHKFIPDAIKSGATTIVHSAEINDIIDVNSGRAAKFIRVPDTTIALGCIARSYLAKLRANAQDNNAKLQTIAITGSVGKTTTKDVLATTLQLLQKLHGVNSPDAVIFPQQSFNNEIGLPLTALRANKETRYLVLEVGANHRGEIANLTQIADPEVAVLLKAGVAHSGEFGGAENIANEKVQIFSGKNLQVGIYNADDGNIDLTAVQFNRDAKLVQLRKNDVQNLHENDDFKLEFDYQNVHFSTQLTGLHNVMNALAVIHTCKALGFAVEEIAVAMQNAAPIAPHRMQVSRVHLLEDAGEVLVIDDAYNANPDSMRAGLDALMRLAKQNQATAIAVLGDMLELGADSADAHAEIAQYASALGVDQIFAVGEFASAYDLPNAQYSTIIMPPQEPTSDSARGKEQIQAQDILQKLSMKSKNMVLLFKASSANKLWELAESVKTLLENGEKGAI